MSETLPVLITGVANRASIAWAVVEAMAEAGQPCLLAVHPANRRRVEKLVERLEMDLAICDVDVRAEESLQRLAAWTRERAPRLGGLLHSIAYADRDELAGRTLDASRAGFLEALDVSAYSLIALTRAVEPLLAPGAGVVALSYHGSRYAIPGYNLMGLAKATLEAGVRYLAAELGRSGVRVNTVSAGPLLTLSSSAFEDIERSLALSVEQSALRDPLSAGDVARMAMHLLSPSSRGVTGQCINVDNGLSVMRSV